jgi:hypothetical protein
MRRITGFLIVVLGLCRTSPVVANAWAASIDPIAGTRFIPVELWTGGAWTGNRDLALPAADLSFGDNFDKYITGPDDWTHPVSGDTVKVYRRENKGKLQLFTVRKDGAGLGRVFDSRGDRVCTDGVKFPLGLWREGETRTFAFPCWKNGRSFMRTVRITIEKIDFEHRGVAHALRYLWVADQGDRKGLNNAYTYAPGKGNVEIEERH